MSLITSTIKSFFKPFTPDMPSFCSLEMVQDETTIVCEDGGLISFFRLNGVRNVPNDPSSMRIFNAILKVMHIGMESTAHSFSIVFENDPESISTDIANATEPVMRTLKRLELELEDIYEDWKSKISSYCQTEKAWLIVYTSPGAIAPDALKRSQKEKSLFMKNEGVPNLASAQSPFKLVPEIINPHKSMCDTIKAEVSSCEYDLQLLNVEQAMFDLKRCIEPEYTDDSWKPVTHLNRKAPPISLINQDEPADFWFPKLGRQLFSKDVDVVKDREFPGEMLKIGSRYYSSMAMSVFPEKPELFANLFTKVEASVPWRICFDIRPAGLRTKAASMMFSKVFGWMGRTNRNIKDGFDYLQARQEQGDRIVGVTINACTWAKTPARLASNEASLQRAMQSWGITQVVTSLGNPITAWAVTLPGFTRKKCSEITAAPLPELMDMLPLQRPTSPWSEGAALMRSMDGKLMPIQPSSNLQTTWNELYYAPPGSGKSVLLNCFSLAMVLSPGLDRLPRIAHLDVGPSASGVISLIQSALPEGRKHEAQYVKISMSEEYAINPFDLEPGCRKPTQIERDFLVNLLCIFATPAGKDKPYEMAAEMAGLMVDEVYKRVSDVGGVPKIYERHQCPAVDKALEELLIELNEDDLPCWYAIGDMLFERGRIHESILAHRYAVPVLDDLMLVIKTAAIRDLFASSETSAVRVDNGQTLMDMYSTVISSARREYPVLSGVTRFDISDARIIVMDLNDVSRGSGPEGRRRAAIMYMLGRQATTKSFYLSKEMLADCPEMYRAYHMKRIEDLKAEKKAIIYDEFHNTGGMEALRKQVVTDMREGRKWNIRVALSSQLLDDFDQDMIKVATSFFILKAGTQDVVEDATRIFNLSQGAKSILENNLSGPKHWGAPFLGYFQTKNGRYTQLFVNTIGPVLRWALTTEAEDMAVRNKLYEALPPADARKLLSEVFPEGSVIEELKRREARKAEGDKRSTKDVLVEDLIDEYYRRLGSIMSNAA